MCLTGALGHLCFSGRLTASLHLSGFDQRVSRHTVVMPYRESLQSKHPAHYRCCYLLHTCIGGLAEQRHSGFLMDGHEIDKLGGKEIALWKCTAHPPGMTHGLLPPGCNFSFFSNGGIHILCFFSHLTAS